MLGAEHQIDLCRPWPDALVGDEIAYGLFGRERFEVIEIEFPGDHGFGDGAHRAELAAGKTGRAHFGFAEREIGHRVEGAGQLLEAAPDGGGTGD
ncbi:hypothetical protein D3C72_2155540 [compost metagenome]